MTNQITAGILPEGSVLLPRELSAIVAALIIHGPMPAKELKKLVKVPWGYANAFKAELARGIRLDHLTEDHAQSDIYYSVSRQIAEATASMTDEELDIIVNQKKCLWIKVVH